MRTYQFNAYLPARLICQLRNNQTRVLTSTMGSIVSSIGYGINSIIFAIASVIEAIVGAIVAVLVAIFDVIGDILCCRCCGGRSRRRTGSRSDYRRRGRFGRGRARTAGAYY